MEKSKNNLGILIAIIVVLLGALIIGGMIGYSLGKKTKQDLQENGTYNNKIQNTLNEKTENNVSVQTENNVINLTESNPKNSENSTEKNELKNEEKYSSIINEYKTAIGDTSLKESSEDISEKYKNVNELMIHYYHNYNDQQFKYIFYDIDNNNVDELIIVSKNANNGYNNIIDIFTHNGTKPVKLIKENLGERTNAQIFSNGIIYIKGSGGATSGIREFGKISSNGKNYETIQEYYYLYDELGNVTFYSDAQEKNKLNYTSVEQIEKIHLAGATEVLMNSLTLKDITPKVD